jgi:uncharacterized membrane protein
VTLFAIVLAQYEDETSSLGGLLLIATLIMFIALTIIGLNLRKETKRRVKRQAEAAEVDPPE